MKTLNWYVTRGFLLAFAMAIGILTFGMTGANLIKVLDYVSQGIPFTVFCKFTVYILPIILTFTVPWAIMVAVMLVFGRMSADNEITAMRACGVSILQIMSPIMIITVLLTALCLYLQVELGPPLLGKSRDLLGDAAINQPLALFDQFPAAYASQDADHKVEISHLGDPNAGSSSVAHIGKTDSQSGDANGQDQRDDALEVLDAGRQIRVQVKGAVDGLFAEIDPAQEATYLFGARLLNEADVLLTFGV